MIGGNLSSDSAGVVPKAVKTWNTATDAMEFWGFDSEGLPAYTAMRDRPWNVWLRQSSSRCSCNTVGLGLWSKRRG